jgi:diadenosine tetraphosphate (Ap4A) HIT family hydrolase
VNETARKFGHPQSVLREFEFWSVLLRPVQVTLGSLVLVCREPVGHFGELSTGASGELAAVAAVIESALDRAFAHDKINYLMLMMVDPDVHFHVIPRYYGEKTYRDLTVPDAGWPGPPRLDAFVEPGVEPAAALISHLQAHWPG